MTGIRNIYKRGWIELTPEAYARYSRYLKKMPQFGIDVEFYGSIPVKKKNAKENAIVTSDGKRKKLCF